MSALLASLLDALIDEPEDAATRGVLLDSLLERDDPRAELLRVVPDLRALPWTIPEGNPQEHYRMPEPCRKGHIYCARLIGVAAVLEMLDRGKSLFSPEGWLRWRRHLGCCELSACRLLGPDQRKGRTIQKDKVGELLQDEALPQWWYWAHLLGSVHVAKSRSCLAACYAADSLASVGLPPGGIDRVIAETRLPESLAVLSMMRTRHGDFFERFDQLRPWEAEQAYLDKRPRPALRREGET